MSLSVLEPEATDVASEVTTIAAPTDARWAPPVSYHDPQFKKHVITKIEALRQLAPGWDGYRAPTIQPTIIESAIEFVNSISDHIAPRPHVVPLIAGTLQLEWVAGGKTLEFEFESETTIHFLQWDPANNTTDEDSFDVGDVARAESLLKWFTRQNVP